MILNIKTYFTIVTEYLDIKSLCALAQLSKNINLFAREIPLYSEFVDYYKKYDSMNMHNIYSDGYFEILKNCTKCQWFKHFFKINLVIENGHAHILKWLIDKNYVLEFNKNSILTAIRKNYIDVIILVYKINSEIVKNLENIYNACQYGHVGILQWYRSINYLPIDQKMYIEASKNGYLEIIIFLMETEPINIDYPLIFSLALSAGHVHIVEKFKNIYFDYEDKYVISSLHNNSRNVYDWYILNNLDLPKQYDKVTISKIINNIFLDIFWKIAKTVNPDNYKNAIKSAITIDDFNVFMFLIQKHTDHDNDKFFYHAVKKNRLKIIQYFINGTESYDIYKACYLAFKHNHTNLIVWFIENKHINPDLIVSQYNLVDLAIKNNSIFMLRWLADHSYNQTYNPISIFTLFENNNIETLKYLYSSNYGIKYYQSYVRYAICNNHIKLIRWLYSIEPDISNIFDQELFYNAIKHNHLKMAKWLLEFKDIKILDYYFANAVLHNSYDIIKWFIYLEEEIVTDYICIFVSDTMDLDVLNWMYEINKQVESFTFANQ